MMLPCDKCLENSWSFDISEGWVKAICKFCNNEVEFETAKKRNDSEWYVGKPCRHCQKPVILKNSPFNPKKLKKAYYYTAYYWCNGCKTFYMSDEFKIVN